MDSTSFGSEVQSASPTDGPNALLAEIHDRMPLILRVDQYDMWLDLGFVSRLVPPTPVLHARAHLVNGQHTIFLH